MEWLSSDIPRGNHFILNMIQMRICRRHCQVSCREHKRENGLLPSSLFESQGQNATRESCTHMEQPNRERRQSMQSAGEGWYLLQRLSRVDTVDWEPAGLSWDLVGHKLTSWHSLSRAPESGSRCRTKEGSHQQRSHPSLASLRNTRWYIYWLQTQGRRPEKHTGSRLPGDACSNSTAGSSSCRQIQTPSQCRSKRPACESKCGLHTPNHCLKTAENWEGN